MSFLKVLIAAAAIQGASAVHSVIDLGYSRYQGVSLQNGITQWLGIRYAAPPMASLRFAAPQDPPRNDTLQVADQHGAICLGTDQPANNATIGADEDCLFLDIYAPSDATERSKLGVYFFIQGGGFNTNSNGNLNGTGIVKASGMQVITVAINYRVGAYGFLAGQEVSSPNNGLKDQRKALEWVQTHIQKFGGDPNRVTMAGDSAGAASVTLQLTAYGGRDDGLFQATAAESQSFAAVRTVAESQYQYDALVIRTGCVGAHDTLDCLRGLNSTYFQNQSFNIPFPGASQPPLYMYGPTLDYSFVTDYTYRAFANGKFVRVPAIYGDDTNEGTIFTPLNTSTIGDSDDFLKNQFPAFTLQQLARVNSLYPVDGTPTFPNASRYWRQVSNAYGEIRYICPGIFLSQKYSELKVPIWNYHWDVQDPDDVAEGYGVPHTVEVNAIWGPENVNGNAPASYNTTNAAIVPVVQGYWTSFVRAHNPNTHRFESTPKWKQWGTEKARLYFRTNATAMETVPHDQQNRCAYLNGIGVDLKQ